MTSGANFYELYRTSSVGTALTDTLDELISSNQLEPQLAMKIIAHFDKAFIETISERVKSRLSFKVDVTTP
jgi:transcription initiation factor TFIIA small subunit